MFKVVEIIRGRKSHSHQLLKLDFHPLSSFIVAEASFQLDIHEEKSSMFKARRNRIPSRELQHEGLQRGAIARKLMAF